MITDFIIMNLKWENSALENIEKEFGKMSKQYKQKLSQIKMLESNELG